MSAPSSALREKLLSEYEETLDFAARQARRIVRKYPDYTPMYTVGGIWNREGERWTHWCEGFFPGIFWLLHKHTGDAEWRQPSLPWKKGLPRSSSPRTRSLRWSWERACSNKGTWRARSAPTEPRTSAVTR